MRPQVSEGVIVGAGLIYLAAFGWAVANVSYDVWGALLIIPVYGIVALGLLRAMFRGPLEPIVTVMYWGLLVKLAGAFARYWVGFEAYAGGIDAASYHRYANVEAGAVWSGDQTVFEVLPSGTGTEFVERFTAFVYTLTGASQLAGFITFALLGYIGLAFFIKAAAVAVPGLAQRKYAWMCVLFPSLVYWPSSIGKEAVVMLGLGVATYGIVVMLSRRQWVRSFAMIFPGLGFVALVRPHMAGIWVAAAVPALVLAVVLGARSQSAHGAPRRSSRFGLVLVLAAAAVGLSVLASLTVRFLDPGTEAEPGTSSITELIEETTRRSAKSGSTFQPPSISQPTSWPVAVGRTLTRPLPIEARGVAQLLSAAELMVFYGFCAAGWKRVRNLPKLLVTNPYIAFAMTALFLGGLAYSSFANLGILTRQKSLLWPFMLLIPCLPLTLARRGNGRLAAQESSDESRSAVTHAGGGIIA